MVIVFRYFLNNMYRNILEIYIGKRSLKVNIFYKQSGVLEQQNLNSHYFWSNSNLVFNSFRVINIRWKLVKKNNVFKLGIIKKKTLKT